MFVAIGCASSLLWVAAASAAVGDVTCTGTAPATVANNLIVPAGTTCTIGPGSTIGYDVVVQQGATLFNEGGQIGYDVQATSPFGISFGGGTTSDGTFIRGRVGHDLKVNGITGVSFPATNFVCSTDIVHDLVLTNSTQSAGEWVVGDSPELCGQGDTVGHDLVVQNNHNPLEISDNRSLTGAPPLSWGVGHDLRVTGNAQAPVVEGNTVFHDAVCQSNVTTDGPNEPGGVPDQLNIAGHINTCN